MLTQQELEDNVQYVLGMTEHYTNDDEIHKMLRMKGLEEADVQKILRAVAYSFALKRMQQHKNSLRLAGILAIFLYVVPLIYFGLVAVHIDIPVLEFYVLFIFAFRFTLGLMIIIPFWTIFSTYQYFKYKKRMKQEENIGAIGIV
ncbi:hypothetical protein [Chitinophaga sancti]|uniref:Uncharacterized protein n=1 Tax=Chitinophaga sancti TaxID=1004 RepID=A0A1K1SXW3_9BACT|nr:hypothetical protein [Chitinophaga sancti]WQD62266.1 hypothetical protein U0033_30710 [Chitinophaga sancti]WQG92165.1 hypothetical protein SR876_11675 [Chitinophaga sancti]SFW88911.1 hypothetical protein SAMN05661012_06331 [Chitinophaga sancti]